MGREYRVQRDARIRQESDRWPPRVPAVVSTASVARVLRRLSIDIVEKSDQAGKVPFLVVVHRYVAAIRTIQITAMRQAASHAFHVGRIHRVVARADGQTLNADTREISGPVPMHQLATRSELTRPLHRDVHF